MICTFTLNTPQQYKEENIKNLLNKKQQLQLKNLLINNKINLKQFNFEF